MKKEYEALEIEIKKFATPDVMDIISNPNWEEGTDDDIIDR